MMLSFNHISKIYPPHIVALDDVSFQVEEGEFVLLVGKSGAGKTTIVKLLLREELPTAGQIFCLDYDLSKIRSSQLFWLRQQIGVVFQDYKLINSKTVFENISYALEVVNAPENVIKRDVPQVLDLVGLKNKARNFPWQLSGGEKQKVCLARALVHRPKIIVADEPTGNLDPYTTQEITKLLSKVNRLGTTVILATHDQDIVDFLKGRIINLEEGKIIRDQVDGHFIL